MHITLVGMSNIGKTHWSNRLAAEAGFERIDCDFLVEQKLGTELTKLGYAGIEDVAKWMGQPYASQYPDTSQKFVNCERAVMREILDKLQSNKATKKEHQFMGICPPALSIARPSFISLNPIFTTVREKRERKIPAKNRGQ